MLSFVAFNSCAILEEKQGAWLGGCMEKQETETDAERGNGHQKRKTTFTNSYLQTRRASISISSLEHS